MDTTELMSRIMQSQQVLWGWRASSPIGTPDTTLSMIAEEIDILDDLASENPESAAQIDELAGAWRQLAAGLEAGAHRSFAKSASMAPW